MKHFIITIDTEGDNLWEWKTGEEITTRNVAYLNRFQDLCEEYGFKPVWLTNYEMICDPAYVDFISKVEERKTGELGMHLHAWNTPPEYVLKREEKGAPYLIEYPDSVMEEKIDFLTETIKKNTGIRPVSHRAGRWATNDTYFQLLKKYGYQVDCSVTPHQDWTGHVGATFQSAGSNYMESEESAYWLDENKTLLEVPLTIRRVNKYFKQEQFSAHKLAGSVKRMLVGENIWLRPGHSGERQMHYLIDYIAEAKDDYLMFMLHSSEFMPGGSPNFKTEESIEILYNILQRLFEHISENFQGITLRDYYEIRKQ